MGMMRQAVAPRQERMGMGDGIGIIMMGMGKSRTAHIVAYEKHYQQASQAMKFPYDLHSLPPGILPAKVEKRFRLFVITRFYLLFCAIQSKLV